MKRALFPGRFLTFHQGHLFAAQMARDLADELVVLVISANTDLVDADTRAAWISAELGCKVLIAQGDDWRDPETFKQIVKGACSRNPEMLVGGFSDLPELAVAVGAEPLVVDRPREIFDLQTVEILADPVVNWDAICPSARAIHQKRICLVGPESVGKSVACAALSDAYQTRVIPEFGRNYEEDLKRGAPWDADDFVTLSRSHIAWADQIARRAGPVVFEDTEIVQTMVWAEHMIGQIPPKMLALEKLRAKPDLYLVLGPDVAWVDDGTRYAGAKKVRQFFFDRLQVHLDALGHNFKVINGNDFEIRQSQINSAVADVSG